METICLREISTISSLSALCGNNLSKGDKNYINHAYFNCNLSIYKLLKIQLYNKKLRLNNFSVCWVHFEGKEDSNDFSIIHILFLSKFCFTKIKKVVSNNAYLIKTIFVIVEVRKRIASRLIRPRLLLLRVHVYGSLSLKY